MPCEMHYNFPGFKVSKLNMSFSCCSSGHVLFIPRDGSVHQGARIINIKLIHARSQLVKCSYSVCHCRGAASNPTHVVFLKTVFQPRLVGTFSQHELRVPCERRHLPSGLIQLLSLHVLWMCLHCIGAFLDCNATISACTMTSVRQHLSSSFIRALAGP